ncbi:MAG TPA: S9 family peptidase [Sedimentisphaerales bacterium]|jgi:dipeptidyl aminopeptidase/acylaminoacyl peptidase|nr:S9 family peptidase [Sedimentisphaerales bacterium]HNU28060.1 S9 family peptidase [Sedimentisphaerales bacterium]
MTRRSALLLAVVIGVCISCSVRVALGQTGEIRPGENLVVQGLPPIPASLADEVRRYTESRSASLADWHPTERSILISTRFADTVQIHRVKQPGGARTQMTFFKEPISGATYEPRTGQCFLFTKDVGGNEFAQIYRYDMADGRITLLTDGGRSQNGGIDWSTRGDRIAYASTRRNGADRDIYVMDPLDPETDQLVLQVSGGGWSVLDWSPDDRQLLIGEYISVNESRGWLLDLSTGVKTLLTEPGPEPVSYRNAQFSKDGAGLYLTTDKDSEFQRLSHIDLATRRIATLVDSIPWDAEDLDLSPDGRTIAFTTNEAGVSRVHLFDIADRRLRRLEAVPTGSVHGLRWHPKGRHLAFSVLSARSPSDVYSIDTQTGELSRWTESELGGLVATELSEPRLVSWPSFDGREITGFLYEPPTRFSGKRPVIIDIHGGPEGQSRPGFGGRYNYFLNECGVSLLLPNVRGSTGYGKTFAKLDNGTNRENAVKDIGALLDWIAKQPNLDASRVMVMGGSYGGYMTLACATHYSDRIRCAIDIVGISNFNTFLKNTESYRRDLRRAEYGDERDPAMQEFFERIAPLNNARKIAKPLFVVQGGNDPRVPRSEAEQMVARVAENGTHVWYLMAKDEGHGFRKKANADFQFYATVLFVRQYLLGSS